MEYYELYHHGILGQRWGIRRFQNPDGTLTSAGKKRYKSSMSSEQKIERKNQIKSTYEDLKKTETGLPGTKRRAATLIVDNNYNREEAMKLARQQMAKTLAAISAAQLVLQAGKIYCRNKGYIY